MIVSLYILGFKLMYFLHRSGFGQHGCSKMFALTHEVCYFPLSLEHLIGLPVSHVATMKGRVFCADQN